MAIRRESPLGQFQDFLYRGSIPFTKAIIICNVVTLFFSLSDAYLLSIWPQLAFSPRFAITRPWTLLTYPFVAPPGDIIGLIFGGLWMWMGGGSLERAWLTRNYILFFLLLTLVSAISLLIGSYLLDAPLGGLSGMWLPIAGVTVAFCMVNWNMDILFWFFPLKTQYLMYIDIALTFFVFAFSTRQPLMGVFGVAGCGFAYAYVRWLRWALPRPSTTVGWRGRQIELGPPSVPKPRRDWNPISAFQRWRRKREFMRLMKQSGFKDEEER